MLKRLRIVKKFNGICSIERVSSSERREKEGKI